MSAEKPEVVGRARRRSRRGARSLPTLFRQILWFGPSTRQVIALIALALLFFCVAGSIDYAAAKAKASTEIMLEDSMRPAGQDECEIAGGTMGRPDATISHQDRADAAYYDRWCWWKG